MRLCRTRQGLKSNVQSVSIRAPWEKSWGAFSLQGFAQGPPTRTPCKEVLAGQEGLGDKPRSIPPSPHFPPISHASPHASPRILPIFQPDTPLACSPSFESSRQSTRRPREFFFFFYWYRPKLKRPGGPKWAKCGVMRAPMRVVMRAPCGGAVPHAWGVVLTGPRVYHAGARRMGVWASAQRLSAQSLTKGLRMYRQATERTSRPGFVACITQAEAIALSLSQSRPRPEPKPLLPPSQSRLRRSASSFAPLKARNFRLSLDEASGIARAWREGREFGHDVTAVWAEAV